MSELMRLFVGGITLCSVYSHVVPFLLVMYDGTRMYLVCLMSVTMQPIPELLLNSYLTLPYLTLPYLTLPGRSFKKNNR